MNIPFQVAASASLRGAGRAIVATTVLLLAASGGSSAPRYVPHDRTLRPQSLFFYPDPRCADTARSLIFLFSATASESVSPAGSSPSPCRPGIRCHGIRHDAFARFTA